MSIDFSQLNLYCKDVFSNDKKKRKKARIELKEQKESFKEPLTKDNKKAFPAFHKISKLVSKALTLGEFPYRIDLERAGVIGSHFIIENAPTPIDSFKPSEKPCYILTMAHTPKLTLAEPLTGLKEQIELVWKESFGKNPRTSEAEADERISLVVGINYCHSLDAQKNKRNREYIEEASSLSSSHVKIMAFNWTPQWLDKEGKHIEQKKVKRFFRILSGAFPEKAKKIFAELMKEKEKIIPFQRIRNEIVRSPLVEKLHTTLKRGVRGRPAFLAILDDDGVRYRTEKIGLLSHYDQLIVNNPKLRIASTGYFMKHKKKDFVEFASRVDLVARRTIAKTIPNGAYFPEPNLFIKITNSEDLKHRISFLRKGKNKGKGLEFLGLLENLELKKGDVNGVMVIGDQGPIQTSQPVRAKVSKHIPDALSPETADDQKILASLRAFCQSAVNPRAFAASVARALPTGAGTLKNMAIIAKLYKALDPIQYSKLTENWKEIYKPFTVAIIKLYNKKIDNEKLKTDDYAPHVSKILKDSGLEINEGKMKNPHKERIQNLLMEKFSDVWTARRSLIEEHPNLTEGQFQTLFITAINTNKAVYKYIESYINKTDFVFPKLFTLDP